MSTEGRHDPPVAEVEAAARARHNSYCPWCPESPCLALGWATEVQYVEPLLTAAHVPELLAENQRLREALRTVIRETGTSSLAHHAARAALASLDLP